MINSLKELLTIAKRINEIGVRYNDTELIKLSKEIDPLVDATEQYYDDVISEIYLGDDW